MIFFDFLNQVKILTFAILTPVMHKVPEWLDTL